MKGPRSPHQEENKSFKSVKRKVCQEFNSEKRNEKRRKYYQENKEAINKRRREKYSLKKKSKCCENEDKENIKALNFNDVWSENNLEKMKKFHSSLDFTIKRCSICCEAWPSSKKG